MKCPYCGYKESKVIDSRPAEEGSSIRRGPGIDDLALFIAAIGAFHRAGPLFSS